MTHATAHADSSAALARGVLDSIVPASATMPGYIVLSLPGSSYRLHLIPRGEITTPVGKNLRGSIAVRARRVDLTRQGGRFIEPVYGRPRRVQGRVIGHEHGKLIVLAGGASAVDGGNLPVVLELTDERQRAEQFPLGEIVGCDVHDGATFTPVA